jgi:hypothetical protein
MDRVASGPTGVQNNNNIFFDERCVCKNSVGFYVGVLRPLSYSLCHETGTKGSEPRSLGVGRGVSGKSYSKLHVHNMPHHFEQRLIKSHC